MKNILSILSSPRGDASLSHQISQQVIDELLVHHPGAQTVVRDVTRQPLPPISDAFVSGIFTPAEQRNSEQAAAVEASDLLVDELLAADVIVIAAPMHNFSIPAALKLWIDHIVRAGRTFSFSDKGAIGHVKDKRAILVVTRGNVYSDGPMKDFEFQDSYLLSILGFIGISDVQVIPLEGVALGPDTLQQALQTAGKQALHVARTLA